MTTTVTEAPDLTWADDARPTCQASTRPDCTTPGPCPNEARWIAHIHTDCPDAPPYALSCHVHYRYWHTLDRAVPGGYHCWHHEHVPDHPRHHVTYTWEHL